MGKRRLVASRKKTHNELQVRPQHIDGIQPTKSHGRAARLSHLADAPCEHWEQRRKPKPVSLFSR